MLEREVTAVITVLVLQVVKESGHPKGCTVPWTKRTSKEWHTRLFENIMANNENRIDNLKEKVQQDEQFRKLKGKKKVTVLLEEVQMSCQQIEHLRLKVAKRERLLEKALTEQQQTCFILGRNISEVSNTFLIN
jgi:hypothetical protein